MEVLKKSTEVSAVLSGMKTKLKTILIQYNSIIVIFVGSNCLIYVLQAWSH